MGDACELIRNGEGNVLWIGIRDARSALWQKQTTKVHVLRMKLEDMSAHLAVAAAA